MPKIYITDPVREATYISARDERIENCASAISSWIMNEEFPSSSGWRVTPQKYFPQAPDSSGTSRPEFTAEKFTTSDNNHTLIVPYINLDAKREDQSPDFVQALNAAKNALGVYPAQDLIFGGNLTGTRIHLWRYGRGNDTLTMLTAAGGLNVFSDDQEIHQYFASIKATDLF